MASLYHSNQLSSKIEKAMRAVKRILSNARNPLVASPDLDHTYDDKFALSEFLSKIALASFFNTFERLDLDKTALGHLVSAVSNERKSVTLRFSSSEKCEFIRKDTIEAVSPQKLVEERMTSGVPDGTNTTVASTKIVNHVKEYHWRMSILAPTLRRMGISAKCLSAGILRVKLLPGVVKQLQYHLL